MRRIARLLFALCALTASGCHTGRWNEQALAYRQAPALASVYQPRRPRVAYEATELPAKLNVSHIEIQLLDGRPTEEVILTERPALTLAVPQRATEVQLPAAIEARVSERVGTLTAGTGPALTLKGRVTQLSVVQEDNARSITSSIAWSLQDGAGADLHAATSEAAYRLVGLAYDRAELDELHALAVLGTLDAFLAKPEVIELINLKLMHAQNAPAPDSQRL